jgi:hypothetical protein
MRQGWIRWLCAALVVIVGACDLFDNYGNTICHNDPGYAGCNPPPPDAGPVCASGETGPWYCQVQISYVNTGPGWKGTCYLYPDVAVACAADASAAIQDAVKYEQDATIPNSYVGQPPDDPDPDTWGLFNADHCQTTPHKVAQDYMTCSTVMVDAGPSCTSDGDTCTTNSDCCTGVCSDSNACEACRMDGEICSTSADCCLGLCDAVSVCDGSQDGGP